MLPIHLLVLGTVTLSTAQSTSNETVTRLVQRLDLGKYKATILELTKFGNRQAGTERNRAANDWIETQLKSYGCNTERIHYDPHSFRSTFQGVEPLPAKSPLGTPGLERWINGSQEQSDKNLRELNAQKPDTSPREEVFCTKVGTLHPEEMYIASAHMDGMGGGAAADDDASGVALVMELARILNSPGVAAERSIRFVLWNSEEEGLAGSSAYIELRKVLQGKEDPLGSGRYPEPKWLGIIQHDSLLYDHGLPHKDGTSNERQRPEADVNVEFQARSAYAAASQELAWELLSANETYASDYPATVGNLMAGTDSVPFEDYAPSVSVRELTRAQLLAGWSPTHHMPSDVFASFSDEDFRLGLNAAQTTLGALARLASVSLK